MHDPFSVQLTCVRAAHQARTGSAVCQYKIESKEI